MSEKTEELFYPEEPDTIACLADVAIRDCSDYISDMMAQYEDRALRRSRLGIPVLAFCGHGRCGKDTAAAWFGANYDINYVGSVSRAVLPLVAHALKTPEERVFAERHNCRSFWFNFCNALRSKDPTLLIMMTLADNDVVAGIRAAPEFEASTSSGMVDLSVWIEREAAPIDPTLEYRAEDCDLIVLNNTTTTQFYRRLRCLADCFKLPPRTKD